MRLLLLSLVAVVVAPAVAGPQRAAQPVVVHRNLPAIRFIDSPSGERVLSTVPTIDPDTGKKVDRDGLRSAIQTTATVNRTGAEIGSWNR